MRFCIIARHLELRERFSGRAIMELNKELSKLREAYAKEIRSFRSKLKKAEDKC